ncbi:histidine kinase [Longibacter salinarum]|uniref:histidine kinase n=1 Tax=Longibacter salinarum TaxID=1850348 RepID=A0A2A8D0T0_9BACT|nr:ATP-binding protein [Longibacter salinarum]PEN14535.1 histidine kinase [Longibacter salinarum]
MRSRFSRFWRRYGLFFGVGLALIVALALTWQLRRVTEATVRTSESQWQERIATEALATIEEDFEQRHSRLVRRARSMARDSTVIRALSAWNVAGERPTRLLRRVSSLRLEERTGVEVRSASGALLAWQGASIPARESIAFSTPSRIVSPRTTIATDSDVRRALAVWWPVEHEGLVIGAVRAVELIQFHPPVQNRYIETFDLESQWRTLTDEAIEITYGDLATARTDTSNRAQHTLKGVSGESLAVVTVRPPSGDRLIEVQTAIFDDLIVLWICLLVFCSVAGCWVAYQAQGRSTENADGDRAALRLLWFFLAAVGWVGLRYVMVDLDVPGRWMEMSSRLAALFDPTHLASTLGWGALQSTGDLLVTAIFAIVSATAFLHLASRTRPETDSLAELAERLSETESDDPRPLRFFLTIAAATGLIMGLVVMLSNVVRRAVLDSTLDYFSRTGVLPEPLVMIVLCSLFLLAVSAVLAGTAVAWMATRVAIEHRPSRWPRGLTIIGITFVVTGVIAGFYVLPVASPAVPIPVVMTFAGIVLVAATLGVLWPHGGVGQLTLRGLLPSVLALTLLLYPMLYMGMDTQRRDRMRGAAMSFEEGRDPRVLYSIEQMLKSSRQELSASFSDRIRTPGGAAAPLQVTTASRESDRPPATTIDSVATRLVQRSLLASLTTYEASLIYVDEAGTPQWRYTASGVRARRTSPRPSDLSAFQRLRSLYRIQSPSGPLVEQLEGMAGDKRTPNLLYAGLIPVEPSADGDEEGPGASGWILVRAEPRSLLPGAGTGVPAVLLPDGSYSDLYAELSLAEFRDGALVRSLGRDFGRARLQAQLRSSLDADSLQWKSESVRGARYLTLYRNASAAPTREGGTQTAEERTIAVRIPSVLAFDHLYYILRLTIAGLFVTFLFYLLGLYGRYQRGLLPAPTVRFRDKVLSAFLAVGVVSMIAVGVVGVQVVTSENERVIQRRLHDHLNRVEETLALEARPGEMMYRVAERIDLDSLAARVGLDLRLYDGAELQGTSRARLVRDRLVDDRLPVDVYRALYDDRYRFATAPSYVGSFRYVVGYQALPGEDGSPRYVLAVPTLAQQERIEEEQARTLAYLFGALLILVVVVMLTALLLANALARPIAQLREGLEAVGEGRFARALPVNTRDEIGDLVRTFNEMREQLRESRRKLAKQERELAWREMARQVAHEIKNPLTPMKLSIQHLRRAYKREHLSDDSTSNDGGFAQMFERITGTLIEQIEALARIANEFSSFARLPTRVPEPLDLNEVIREATRLMREEDNDVDLILDLHHAPLVVEADREELRRIFINLIKNAIQAIPQHREGEIVLSTLPTQGEGDALPSVKCTIEDNGTGIPESLRDKIFQPNFSTKTSGTGLGLAIARKSIEELDGQIDFSTVEGEGTTFRIRLPLSEEAPVEA